MNFFKNHSEYYKNIAVLMSGTTLAQSVLILISPILTRIYTPADFAILALFTSFTAVFGAIASGRYELAIVLPKDEKEAIQIFNLSAVLSFGSGVLLAVIIFFFHDIILIMVNNAAFSFYLYFVPIAVFLIGLFNALNYYFIRNREFKIVSKVKIIRQLSGAFFQLLWGVVLYGPFGLVGGRIFLHLTGDIYLIKQIKRIKNHIALINKNKIKELAKRYINFPKFSLTSQLSNTLSVNINLIFISYLFGDTTLGLYALVDRVLNLPVNIIGSSFGQVFLQKANDEKLSSGKADKIYIETLKKLVVIGFLIFFPAFWGVKYLFGLVFGAKWALAGMYAQIIMPLLFMRFIASPLSMINIVFEKQNIAMYWQLSLLATVIISFLIVKYENLTIIGFLKLLTASFTFLYLILIIITYKFSKGEKSSG